VENSLILVEFASKKKSQLIIQTLVEEFENWSSKVPLGDSNPGSPQIIATLMIMMIFT
jgi:hypothetical protein